MSTNDELKTNMRNKKLISGVVLVTLILGFVIVLFFMSDSAEAPNSDSVNEDASLDTNTDQSPESADENEQQPENEPGDSDQSETPTETLPNNSEGSQKFDAAP